MADHAGTFVWYELTTPDIASAQAFYGAVAGWSIVDAGMPGVDYRIARAGDVRICGMMAPTGCEPPAGARPGWLGYVAVADVDASAARVTAAGGRVTFGPRDIPGVGRFCMAADPQGAAFALFRGDGTPPPMPPPGTPATGSRPSPSMPACSAGKSPWRSIWGRWAPIRSSPATGSTSAG